MEANEPDALTLKRAPDALTDTLAEQLWRDLDGRLTRERIRQVTVEVAAEFHEATITTYVPLLIRRYARERLKREIISDPE